MIKLNQDLENISDNNSFLAVSKIVLEYKNNNPNKKILSLGVGDVSKAVVKPVIEAMHKAVDDLASMDTFKGYGPKSGYSFLKKKILDNDYYKFDFTMDELYISNGTKTDITSILELFSEDAKIAVTNPLYPIYLDGAKTLNRECYNLLTDDNFMPIIPKEKYDVIYLCSPNNPTGIAYNNTYLSSWVKYAKDNNAVILYDNVYNAFITSKDVPKSIYEIPDAKKVAIEFRSFSKNASFTGVRCSYYVIPNMIANNINKLWQKRLTNRFNGVSYIAQKGAMAVYTKEAKKAIRKNIAYYQKNANYLKKHLLKLNFNLVGGTDSPYLWVKIKDDISSWDYFTFLLNELNIVVIPGIVFGSLGDKYFRISALAKKEVIKKAVERLEEYYDKKK